jgi:hypothetical protein
MTVNAVASRPNVGLDVDASKVQIEVATVTSRPNVMLGGDACRSNMEVDTIASRPNVGLSVDAYRSNMAWIRPILTWCGRSRVQTQHGVGVDASSPHRVTKFSVGRVVTIMHKLQNHHFKRIIIFKILMDMHLLMLPLLKEILRKHCMHSLKNKRQSTLKMLKL